jgi:steroid delta-isomerase-like uncharacterized protein
MENIQKNKQLVRRAVEEIWNGARYDSVEEFASRDFVAHASTPENEVYGTEGIRQFFTDLRKAFPDIHFTIMDMVAEGDKVATHWTAEGTHKGNFRGIPATGRHFRITSIDIDRIENGKVRECWSNMDELSLLQQLGVIPTPENQL